MYFLTTNFEFFGHFLTFFDFEKLFGFILFKNMLQQTRKITTCGKQSLK